MTTLFDIRWLLMAAGILAVCFLLWVAINFARDRMRKRERSWRIAVRHHKGGIWE